MSDTRLDPATMMEEKPSNNIDLTKKIKTPGPGDPPKKSKPEAPNLGEGITVEPSKLNETDADNNIYASAEWSRDKSLKHLESVLGNDKDPWFWDKINPRYVDTRDIGSTRLQMGEAQGSLAKVGDGLVQFGGNAAATFLKEFSYLFDVHNHLSGGKDPGNWFTDAITPIQEALNEEFAIYRTSEDDVAFGEIGWIAEGIGQMGTTAGMLGAMLVTRGVGGTAGRLISALSKARKMEGAASFTNKLKAAYKATGALKNSTWGSDFGYAVLSRAGESAMEADDTYRSIKEELISMGIDPDMAEAKASQAASEVYKGNWLMLGQDILQQRMFSGLLGKGGFFGGKTAEKVAEGAAKGGVWSKAGKYLTSGYGVGKDMVAEGMEEAYQYWVQEQARNKALVTSGLKSGPQYKAFNEFLTDGQMWNSAIWGAAGSAMMSGGMKAIGYLNKKREEIRANTNMTPSEKADALMEVEEELSKVESRMILPVKIKDYYDAISEASLTGNTETVANLLTRMAVDSAITDVITGKEAEGAILKETFAANPAEALSKLMNGEVSISEEQSKLLQATGESYVAAYNKAQELFNKNKTKYNSTAVAQAFTVAEMDVELTASKSKANQVQITELKSKIAEKLPEEAKVVSSQVEEQFRQKAAERAILQAEMLEITNADDKEALVGIKAAKAKAEADLKDSTKKLEEFEKSEDTSKEDKKALKDNGFDLLGKTTEGEQLLSKMISDYMNLSAQTNAKEFLKNLTEEGVKKIQEKNEKIRKANEKAKSSNAAEDAEGNTVRNPNNATNENIEETLEEDENVEPVDDPNAEDGDEYYDRADQSFNNNELAEETKLSFENGVAWRSNNQGLTSNETQPAYEYKEQEQMPGDLENRKHVTAFLENPNTDFSQYELEYQVDMERLEHTATKNIIPDAQLKAIKEGKEVPAMGMLPIKILIIDKATGKPKSVNGNPLTLFIHNANPVDELVSLLGNSEAAKNLNFPFRSDIMESAIAQTVQEKKEIYENFKAGKPNFRGDLVKKNKGHVIRGEEKSIASLSDEITPDNEMGIGTGVHIKLPNGRTTSIGTKNPKPGVVFVKHNDGWIPVKTRKLTQEEADVVVSIYEAILEVMSKTTNNKPSEVKLSDFPDLKKKINALGNFGFISKEATLIDALNVFVYQGSNTKGNRKLIAFKDSKRKTPLVSMGDNLLFNLEDLRGEKRQAAIDHLMNNKLRNIELQRLGDKAYKSHVMDFLTTKLSTTPEGNLFVQPTFVHERKSKLTKATEKTAQEIYEESLKRDIAEEQERVAAGEGAADLLAEMESKLEEQQVQKETTPVSTDAKADIERRRQESNKNQLNEIGSNRFLKLNKEGENTELSEVELKLINSLIDRMISQGKSAKEINAELISRGFIQSQATTPAQIETYLQSRIDGKINAKVGESISQEINAKYDAEYVDAVKKGELTKEQAMQALEEAGRKDSKAYTEIAALEGTTTSSGNVAKAGAVIGDTFYEDIYEKVTKTGERTGKEANLDGRENKINAKYDTDILILERIKKYNTPVYNFFAEIPSRYDKVLTRAFDNLPVDPIAFKEAFDYIYNVYKDVLRLKQEESKSERVEKSLTSESLADLEKTLSDDLYYLAEFEEKLKNPLSLEKSEEQKSTEDKSVIVEVIKAENLFTVTENPKKAEKLEPSVIVHDTAETDKLIQDRINKYDIPIFDPFVNMSESHTRVLTRALAGIPVDKVTFEEALNFIYEVYKDIVRLKDPANNAERLQKSLTIDMLNSLEKELTEDLNYFVNYQTQLKYGQPIKETPDSDSKVQSTSDAYSSTRRVEARTPKEKESVVKPNLKPKPESTPEVVKDFKLHIPGVGIFYLDNEGVVRDSNAEVIIDPIINNRINIAKASNDGTLTRDGKYAILPNGTVVDTETYKTAENYKAKEEVTTQEVSDPTFDKELAQKIQDKLQELYPEIKLNITNEPVWQRQSKNIFNQEQYNNEVNFRLKAVEILSSDKAKQIFEKGQKNNWTLNKVLDEIGGFGNRTGYKNLFTEEQLNSNVKNLDREQLALELTSNYSYAVEINTAKIKDLSQFNQKYNEHIRVFEYNGFEYRLDDYYAEESGIVYEKAPLNDLNNSITITEQEFNQAANNAGKKEETPTQHYSNLTVPGGANYTENEIATPAITPSIQGHAQFATDNGIGWFRSDEQVIFGQIEDDFADLDEGERYYAEWVAQDQLLNTKRTVGGETTKTRRILEVQSDLFQKGRDKDNLISNKNNERSYINTWLNYVSKRDKISLTEANQRLVDNNTKMITVYRGEGTIIDLNNTNIPEHIKASKGRWFTKDKSVAESYAKNQNGKLYAVSIPEILFNNISKELNLESTNGVEAILPKELVDEKVEVVNDKSNQFLQLLNKDNNWVTFFVKSIIQDSAKQTVTEVQESDVEAKVRELEEEGLLEIDCKGKLKAKDGIATLFEKGGKWEVITDFKNAPTHKSGGKDISIQGKKVEIEKNELRIENDFGDVAVIPSKYRIEVQDAIKSNCHSCIDGIVESLPKMKDYAGDGTVFPFFGRYRRFKNSLPDNLKNTPESDYAMRYYWRHGNKPKSFDDALNREQPMFTMENDGFYHAPSVEPNTLRFLKPKNHPTLQYELDWYNSDNPDAIDFRSKYDLDTSGKFYRYVPKKQ